MKWGALYGPDYVNRLFHGVSRHLPLPHRFICFTDDASGLEQGIEVRDIPPLTDSFSSNDLRWRKLAVFARELGDIKGTALFLDLDVVVVGDLTEFITHPGDFLIIRDDALFKSKPLRKIVPARDQFLAKVGNSSVFRFEIGEHSGILERYRQAPHSAHKRFEISQHFLSSYLLENNLMQYWPAEWCVSFKNHCVPRLRQSYLRDPELPPGAKIVVFAGEPKITDVLDGKASRWYRRIGDVEWLRQAWIGSA